MVCGVGGLLAVTVILIVGVGILTSLVGFVYPAFKSFEAIETKRKGDDTQWLVYWVIFSFFTIMETFTEYLLYWIPFYYAFKIAFLLWAMLPQTKGAQLLYDTFLKDFMKKNESKIDKVMEDAKKNASSIAGELAGAGKDVTNTLSSTDSENIKKDS